MAHVFPPTAHIPIPSAKSRPDGHPSRIASSTSRHRRDDRPGPGYSRVAMNPGGGGAGNVGPNAPAMPLPNDPRNDALKGDKSRERKKYSMTPASMVWAWIPCRYCLLSFPAEPGCFVWREGRRVESTHAPPLSPPAQPYGAPHTRHNFKQNAFICAKKKNRPWSARNTIISDHQCISVLLLLPSDIFVCSFSIIASSLILFPLWSSSSSLSFCVHEIWAITIDPFF